MRNKISEVESAERKKLRERDKKLNLQVELPECRTSGQTDETSEVAVRWEKVGSCHNDARHTPAPRCGETRGGSLNYRLPMPPRSCRASLFSFFLFS